MRRGGPGGALAQGPAHHAARGHGHRSHPRVSVNSVVFRDGEVNFELQLQLQLLLDEELGNFSYFSYSYHYQDSAQEVT